MNKQFAQLTDRQKNNFVLFANQKEDIQVIRFEYEYGNFQTYVSFPKDDYFTECLDRGSGGGYTGRHVVTCQNVWAERKYYRNFKIMYDEQDLLITRGILDFCFLKKVEDIELLRIFGGKYLKIPDDVRNIEYSYKLVNQNSYLIIDRSAYMSGQNSQRAFFINNGIGKQMIIKDYERYRDGGTTYMTLVDERGNEHKFFSPSGLNSDENIYPTLNDNKMVNFSKTDAVMYESLIRLLGIELPPDDKDED